ncbi:hypothetical protein F3Y22_tig00110730pilonHSYRG00048 [Hibiscus syriacus]|uniref:Disease resistance protein winged helix domain-containing protein n=1 Tax=Hibiscus syriacus TaxID=106335 RepID=A0A6A2ZTJ9_HIBSY|nr:hypothetical protein F3Y22_tig00110730pilonHSYRG00048 [Hibiscus syriacus]
MTSSFPHRREAGHRPAVLRCRQPLLPATSYSFEEAFVGPVNRGSFGGSPNYVATHHIAETWTAGVDLLETSVGQQQMERWRGNSRGGGWDVALGIGKQIVQKCGGVPLALKALGSMLRFKHRESEIWELQDDGGGILPVLRLRYDNLPSYSRQCFAYCSIFPKDCEMDKSQLIELWIANGFVPCRGRRDLHEIGYEIFLELTWRSSFQEVREGNDGTVTCKMHDLVYDLAISILRFECYMFGNNECFESLKKIRHLHIPIRYALPRHLERVLADC